MEKPDVHENPHAPDYQPPMWAPPPPPAFGERAWFEMMMERYGFGVAAGLTVVALLWLFFNADLLLTTPKAEQDTPAEIVGEATVSILTRPAFATVLLDGDSVGVSPIRNYTVPAGTYLLSIRKPDHAAFDTVLTVSAETRSFLISLRRDNGPPGAAVQDLLPPGAASDEGDLAAEAPASGPPVEEPRAREAPAEPPPAPAAEGVAETEDEAPVEEAPAEEPPATPAVGTVEVTSQPADALVLLDGVRAGRTPLTLTDVPAGPHRLAVQLAGYQTASRDLDVEPGRTHRFAPTLDLETGTLRVLARPWGAIYIDGELHKEEASAWYAVELPVGNYRVRVVHPTLGRWEQVVTVSAGTPQEVVVDFTGDN